MAGLIALIAATLELVGRTIQAPEEPLLVFDEQSFWGLHPRFKGTYYGAWVETDSFGLRLHRIEGNREPSPARILALGDSRTFGLGVPSDRTYPAQLEARINRSGNIHYEVLNAAVPGYTVYQGCSRSEIFLNTFRPRAVILGFGHNDNHLRDRHEDSESPYYVTSPLTRRHAWVRRTGIHALLKFLDRWLDAHPLYHTTKTRLSLAKTVGGTFDIGDIRLKMRVPPSTYRRILGECVATWKQEGVEVLILHLPEYPGVFLETEAGVEALGKGQTEAALDAFQRAKSTNNYFSPRPHFFAGKAHIELGDTKKAEAEFELADLGSRFYPLRPLKGVVEGWKVAGLQYHRSDSVAEIGARREIANPDYILDEYREIHREVAREFSVKLIDFTETAEDSWYVGDNVHFNSVGNAAIARVIHAALFANPANPQDGFRE